MIAAENTKKFLSLLKTRDEQRKAIEETEALVKFNYGDFLSTLKDICLDGVKAYNNREGILYRVMNSSSFVLRMDTNDRTITAQVKLNDSKGHEPFGDLDLGDRNRIADELGQFINPLLEANDIPFRFVAIVVPLAYFM